MRRLLFVVFDIVVAEPGAVIPQLRNAPSDSSNLVCHLECCAAAGYWWCRQPMIVLLWACCSV